MTGESSDFQVVVNTPAAGNEDNTGIYLYNAILKSSNSPILVKNAKKTILHLVKGTSNVVEDGKGDHLFVTVNGKQDTAKAAIYSKDDMNIKGKGSLEVSGGTLNITAKAGDGLESDECEKDALDSCINIIEGKGIVNISGGAITIVSGDDGVSATNYILVSDSIAPSAINIRSTGKGFVAEKVIYVNGGTTVVDADDDAMHTHWNIYMNAGNVTVSSKDDGLHADSSLYMRGSTINIVTATEGIEAYKIFAEGGVTSTFATDDGWNGAGGPKNGNATGMLSMLSESGGYIVISGGYHYISAKGNMFDVLDANGTATMTGGVLILEIIGESYESGMGMGGGGCSTNIPGGLIDTDNGFNITGGVLLAFGDYTTDVPGCDTVSYTSDNYYGSENAAFKPTYKGSTILYGGEVKSVGLVETSGMKEFKFPNGVSYMYK